MAHLIPMFIDIAEAVALSRRHANTIKRWGRDGKFKWSKPGGTRNAPWSIDRESFIAFMRDDCDQQRQRCDLAKRDQDGAPDGTLLVLACLPRFLPEGCDLNILKLSGHGVIR
jgi:hypothetical protein